MEYYYAIHDPSGKKTDEEFKRTCIGIKIRQGLFMSFLYVLYNIMVP